MATDYDVSDKIINWRTIGVKRDIKFEPLTEILTTSDETIFKNLKDLMVFAAVVAFSQKKRETLTSGDYISIILDTYSNTNQDCFIYLLALMTTEDGNCLRDENLHSSVRVFEEYCHAGLSIIDSWIKDNPTKKAVDIVLDKIYEKICDDEEKNTDISNSDLELPSL